MKTRNVDLNNTPLLTNNVCKYIYLEAPSLPELKKKVKQYEILLVRALTNAYKLAELSLDKNGTYTILPDGNYQSSIFLNFSGMKKVEITNPERTLQYIKHLTAMESKKPEVDTHKPKIKQKITNYHKTITIPIEIKPGDIEVDVISSKQRQILEKLIEDTNLIKISFFRANKQQNPNTNITTVSLKVTYNYIDVIETPRTHFNSDALENR